MAARLPTVGGDDGNWGDVLNTYLQVAHNSDGTLKNTPQHLPTLLVAASDASSNVKNTADYLCDGTADQTEINNAIAALPASGGTIILSEGNFTISGVISLNSSVILTGQGPTTILTRSTTGNVIEIVGTSGTHKTFAGVSKLKLIGPSTSGTPVAGVGIYIDYTDDCFVSDCIVTKFGSLGDDGSIQLRRTTRAQVLRNVCYASINGIITGTSTSTSFPEVEKSQIIGNICHTNWNDGIHGQQSARILFANNFCYSNSESGIDLLGDNGDVVTGNLCYSNTHMGIELGNSTSVGNPDTGHAITGNTCHSNTLYGIGLSNNTEYCTVTGNNCYGNTTSGIDVGGNAGKVSRYNIVSGNNCSTNGTGIRVINNANNNHITGNFCRSNTSRGIYLVNSGVASPDNNSVYNNRAENNTTAQIAVNSATNSLFRSNIGYVSENKGVSSVANAGTIAHGLSATPTKYGASATAAKHIVAVTAVSSTNLTIALYDDTGTAVSAAENVSWWAEI